MRPYAELLEFNQPNPYRKIGHTRIRDAFPGLGDKVTALIDGRGLAPAPNPERIVEFAGRWDYGEKNAKKLGEQAKSKRKVKVQTEPDARGDWDGKYTYEMQDVDVPIIQKYIDMGHESMLEMAWATFFLECSRVVSHELVRHRLMSVQQESQRFVKYDDEDPEDLFYIPDGIPDQWQEEMLRQNKSALVNYKDARDKAMAPQLARYVLPNAMRTRMIVSANLREWRHILNLRMDKSAQPEMQELMKQVYDQLLDVFPNLMYGVGGERGVR